MRRTLEVFNFFAGCTMYLAGMIGGVCSTVYVAQGRWYLTIAFVILYVVLAGAGVMLGIPVGVALSQKGGWLEAVHPSRSRLAVYFLGVLSLVIGSLFLVWILEPISMRSNAIGVRVGLAGIALVVMGILAVKRVLKLDLVHLDAWCAQWRSF